MRRFLCEGNDPRGELTRFPFESRFEAVVFPRVLPRGNMRVLIVSLSTYTAPYNDGKLKQLGMQLGSLTAVSGDVTTLWGRDNHTRSHPEYKVFVLPLRFAQSNATAQLVGLDSLADSVDPTIVHVECEPWQEVAAQCVRLAHRLSVPIGIQFAENGPLLSGIGGALRRARGSWVLRQCDYAVGWATASTLIAERLAPGIRTETFPAVGVSDTSVPTSSSDFWFGADSTGIPKLAFIGRFEPEKGIHDFLAVCDQLSRHLPLRAAIAGGTGDYEAVRRWAEERPWALFHGLLPRPNVGSLLAAADVLVCPSRTTKSAKEQFGRAAVEAMALGTPVFAYDCGALSEVIRDGGFLVPEGAQDQLVTCIKEYLKASAVDKDALAQQAQRQAERFTDDSLAKQLVELWSTFI
jgi:glycosyltransferase involved in cell wall biosynthesis